MTLKPLKTLNFGGEDTYYLNPEWENIEGVPFGETTVMGDTITWDGDTSKVLTLDPTGTGQMLLCHVSDATPTQSDFANGAKLVVFDEAYSMEEIEREVALDEILPIGNGVLAEGNFNFVIVSNDNTTVTVPFMGMTLTVTFAKKGTYFGMTVGSGYAKSLTINGYTGFEMIEITPIDAKYLPFSGIGYVTITAEGTNISTLQFINPTADKTFAEITDMILQGIYVIAVLKNNGAFGFAPLQAFKQDEWVHFASYDQQGKGLLIKVSADDTIEGGIK